jgi:outer membrane protein assembly factor BamB
MLPMSTQANAPFLSLLTTLGLSALLALTGLPGVASLSGIADASDEVDSPLALSAVPPRERELRQRLQRAALAVESGNADESVERLREVLESGHLTFVDVSWMEHATSDTVTERFAGAQNSASRLVNKLTARSQRLYRQQAEPLATAALQNALLRSDADRLREVIVRFKQTHGGLRALQTLAAWSLDRGAWRVAEVAYARILNHPLLPPNQRDVTLRRIRIARDLGSNGNRPEQRTSDRLFPVPQTPAWRRESDMGSETAQLVRDAFGLHEEQSIPLLPRARPVVSGDIVLNRTPRGLSALDLNSGRTIWNATLPGTAHAAPLTVNPSLQYLVSRSLAKQLQLDTVQSRFVVDQDLVFTAEPLSSGKSPQSHTGPFGPILASPAHNGIVARFRTSGEMAWAFTASDLVKLQGDAFFTGPPTVVDDEAIGLVQVDKTLHLYALSRDTGRLRWTRPIAETPRHSSADIDWHAIACPVIEAGGTLVCPTAAGLVVGIDLVTRSPLWAIRFPRSDVPPATMDLPAKAQTPRRHWWNGWREVEFAVEKASDSSREMLVLTSPDNDAIQAIDPTDGSIVWKRHIATPLYSAGVFASRAIVVERHAISGLDLATGATAWRTPIAEPVGRGCLVELKAADQQTHSAHHVLPVRGGVFVAVRLSDGAVQSSATGHQGFAGALEFASGRFVAVQLNGVSAWTTNPVPPDVPGPAETPNDDVAARLELTHAAARKATQAGDFDAAFDLYADVLNLNPSSEIEARSIGPARRVRHDHLVQGELLDLIAAADASTRKRLRQRFEEWSQQAAASADPFALQRFASRWRGIPWVSDLAVRDEVRIGLDFARSQLDLLRLVEQQEPDASTAAAKRLAELYESRSYDRDADAVRSRFLATNPEPSHTSPWPTRTPTVSEHPERQADVGYRMIPVECQPGTLFERLNVTVSDDTRGMRLRFFGDGHSGYWQLSLPRSNSAFRGFPVLARGWGVGHFLVLRIGTELFGITPFDSSGEPRARILWSRTLADHQRLSSLQLKPSRPGFSISDLTLLDEFDRSIGTVGPVTAGTLCYQSGGKLICLDTASGRRLWERAELPRNNMCTGDGRSIWLVQPQSGDVAVIRTLDGRQTGSFRLNDLSPMDGRILAINGPIITMGEPGEETPSPKYRRIAVLDLAQREMLWSSDAIDSAKPQVEPQHLDSFFAIGTHWLGRLTPAGNLRVIDIATGGPVAECTVEQTTALRTAFHVSDAGSHVIALAETDEVSFQQVRNVYRNPPLTGTLLALDSRTGELLWQRRLAGVRLALDQPKNSPFLVLSYERKRAGENAGFESILQILDRRTGVDLRTRRGGEHEDRFVIEPNVTQNRASIRFARRSIRLDYAPAE